MVDEPPTSRFVEAHDALRKNRILGDVGLAATIALVVAVLIYFYGGEETVWGVPISLVFGGGAFVAVFGLSASLGIVPDADDD